MNQNELIQIRESIRELEMLSPEDETFHTSDTGSCCSSCQKEKEQILTDRNDSFKGHYEFCEWVRNRMRIESLSQYLAETGNS